MIPIFQMRTLGPEGSMILPRVTQLLQAAGQADQLLIPGPGVFFTLLYSCAGKRTEMGQRWSGISVHPLESLPKPSHYVWAWPTGQKRPTPGL